MKNTKPVSLAIAVTALCATLPSNAAVIADAAADYVAAASATTAPTALPDGWQYLYSSASTGGTEVAMTANTALGNSGNTGFRGTDGSATTSAIVLGSLTNATVGAQYEIFADGFDGNGGTISSGNAGVVGTDILISPGNAAARAFTILRSTISLADINANGTTASIAGSFRELIFPTTVNANNQGSVDVFVYHNAALLFSVDQANAAATGGKLTQAAGTFNLTNITVAAGDTISFVVGSNGNSGQDETALQAQISLIPEPSSAMLGALGLLALLRRRR